MENVPCSFEIQDIPNGMIHLQSAQIIHANLTAKAGTLKKKIS